MTQSLEENNDMHTWSIDTMLYHAKHPMPDLPDMHACPRCGNSVGNYARSVHVPRGAEAWYVGACKLCGFYVIAQSEYQAIVAWNAE